MSPTDLDPENAEIGVRAAPLQEPPPVCAFTLPAAPAAAWAARARVRAWMEGHHLPPEMVDDVAYMTSEAVSSAAEHAYPPELRGTTGAVVEVAAELVVLAHRLRRVQVRVRDHGRWRPVNPDPGHRGHGLAAMVALAVELTVRHHDGAGTEIVLLSDAAEMALPAAGPRR